jgi:hypothetical protein
MPSGTPIYQIANYDQGDEGATMEFIASWSNSPKDSLVSFHAMIDPIGGPVTLPLTAVPTANGAVGISQTVQAGYTSQLVLVFFPGSTVPADFRVDLRVQYVVHAD